MSRKRRKKRSRVNASGLVVNAIEAKVVSEKAKSAWSSRKHALVEVAREKLKNSPTNTVYRGILKRARVSISRRTLVNQERADKLNTKMRRKYFRVRTVRTLAPGFHKMLAKASDLEKAAVMACLDVRECEPEVEFVDANGNRIDTRPKPKKKARRSRAS